jgi:alpha,alpha-trehalase
VWRESRFTSNLDRRRFAHATLAILVLFGAAAVHAAAEPLKIQSPQQQFQELYVAVEEARLFSDSKTFADATPLSAPEEILAAYRADPPATREALQAFVATHFTPPESQTPPVSHAIPLPIGPHIDQLWDTLTRHSERVPDYGSLLALPQPYVVPGGRFRELYYWDSYFTMLGLAQSGRQDLLEDMVRDFAALIDTYGHVPNGTRSYYLSRSQPPFFFEMVALLSPDDPVAADVRYLPQLRKEYAFWMQGAPRLKPGMAHRRVVAMPDGSILNRYWDDLDTPRDESYAEDTALARTSRRPAPQLYRDLRAAAESGWDFGSRWLADGRTLSSIETTAIVPVDLNSLLFGLESAITAACQRQRQARCASEFGRYAAQRRDAMDRYLWDPQRHTYLDYRWLERVRSPRLSAAMFYPLFVAMSSAQQARQVANAARPLLLPGGLATTTVASGQQWDAPNGWAPLQWIAIQGLRSHGEEALAQTLACRWLVTVNILYAQSGRLIEKYNVEQPGESGGGGEYPLQDGFGWTNGVVRQLMALYPAEASYARLEQCP